MLFNVTSFIDKRDEARVFFSKEEIVRRATCKFVRNFHPPPALVPSRREKRDTGTGRGGKTDAILEEDEEPEEEEEQEGRWKKAGVFCSWLVAIYAPEIARPPLEMKRREEKG